MATTQAPTDLDAKKMEEAHQRTLRMHRHLIDSGLLPVDIPPPPFGTIPRARLGDGTCPPGESVADEFLREAWESPKIFDILDGKADTNGGRCFVFCLPPAPGVAASAVVIIRTRTNDRRARANLVVLLVIVFFGVNLDYCMTVKLSDDALHF
ncbi:hypothetical protein FB451DRAFT_1175034 [Mycena latifolia]|nr:hypothetical protein FB451DRAFT_1175034 [Mycena latifolia]